MPFGTHKFKPQKQTTQERFPTIANEAIIDLHNHFKGDMKKVEQIIADSVKSDLDLISIIASHLIMAGGKRIRSLLTVACGSMFKNNSDELMYISAAAELIHTATLLHDDVIDDAEIRRGQPSANVIWGNAPSVLVGDFLYSKSFQLLVKSKNHEVLNILARTSTLIAEGELWQLKNTNENLWDNTEENQQKTPMETNGLFDNYIQVIGRKTAALFAAACQVGGALNNESPETQNELYQFGHNLGILFQMEDDIKDYLQKTEASGKLRGNDLKEGKVTLPIIMAFQNQEARIKLSQVFKNRHQEEALSNAVEIMKEYGAFNESFKVTKTYAMKAFANLNNLPACTARTYLKNMLAEYTENI